jgi:phospholipase/lecithinase/hemolysin
MAARKRSPKTRTGPASARSASLQRDDAGNERVVSHVRYVDLRPTLSNAANYKRSWANEFHPTDAGFTLIAAQFASAITGP